MKAQNLREREIADKQFNELKEKLTLEREIADKQLTLERQRSDLHCEAAVEKAKLSSMENLMKYNFSSEYQLTRTAANNEKAWWKW